MKTFLLLVQSALLFTAPLLSAETLGDLARQSGQDWMMGKWESVDGRASVSYEWKLEKNAVGMKFKMGERESEGMMMLQPGTEVVTFTAADNAGGMTTGIWSEHEGHLILTAKHKASEGNEINMAFEHIKTDADTMTVKVYGLTASGAMESTPKFEIVYKRQK